MLWPPKFTFVCPSPVAVLDPRPHGNRVSRRKARHGKATVWEKLDGKMTPKEMRESGL